MDRDGDLSPPAPLIAPATGTIQVGRLERASLGQETTFRRPCYELRRELRRHNRYLRFADYQACDLSSRHGAAPDHNAALAGQPQADRINWLTRPTISPE